MELLGYLRFPAKNSIGGNVNLSTYFQQDALPRFPWLPYMFVDINDLRMRINLQHHECFPLAAVGFKSLFIECMTPHSARAILLTTSRIVQVCLYGWTLQTFQSFSLIGWKIYELLGVKISSIPYHFWTTYLSLTWPSPIGMKLGPDERSGPMTHWGQVPKNSYRPIFELWTLKFDIC